MNLLKWLKRDKDTAQKVRENGGGTPAQEVKGYRRRGRGEGLFLLRSGKWVSRHDVRCHEITGADVHRILARRSDRKRYATG